MAKNGLGYTSSGRPVSALKPPPPGPAAGVARPVVSEEHRRQVAAAVNKMLAARGGSAFRITAGQRRAILNEHRRQTKRPGWLRWLLRWAGR